jgi:hypothetical protein
MSLIPELTVRGLANRNLVPLSYSEGLRKDGPPNACPEPGCGKAAGVWCINIPGGWQHSSRVDDTLKEIA